MECRVAACPEDLGDGKGWSFYVLNDGAASIDVLLKTVGHEWNDQGSTENPGVSVPSIAPGGHALLWRDNDEEVRMWLTLEVRADGAAVEMQAEFPLLYRKRDDLPTVAALGKRCWETRAVAVGKDGGGRTSRPGRQFLAIALFATAAVILYVAVQPSTRYDLAGHWPAFGGNAAPAAVLIALAASLAARRLGIALGIAGLAFVAAAALAHPVCIAIPVAEAPAFESVISLEERARQGEPFARLDGRWYQCKSYLSRAFFF